MAEYRTKRRMGVGGLVLSAAAIASIAGYEGYKSRAYVPVPGDKVTIGHGTTRYENGQLVKHGDTVTPERAMVLLKHDASDYAREILKCAPVPMHQHELDALVSLAFNVGPGAVCRSSIRTKLIAGDYDAACKTILQFKRVQGRDCSAPENRRFCGGVWTRRQAEYQTCIGAKP